MKQCSVCCEVKSDTEFYKGQRKCKPCHNAYSAAYRAANKEKASSYMKTYYQDNKEKLKIVNADHRVRNKEKYVKYQEKYRLSNKEKWAAAEAKRRAAQFKATPLWADADNIQAYYDVAGFFNEVNGYIKYHVDHIVPLQGENVTGLHVHQNLRVILAAENISKKNKFEI